jgi:hypothetical protein
LARVKVARSAANGPPQGPQDVTEPPSAASRAWVARCAAPSEIIPLQRPGARSRKIRETLNLPCCTRALSPRCVDLNKLKHVRNADTLAADTRAPSALTLFHGDSVKALKIHNPSPGF